MLFMTVVLTTVFLGSIGPTAALAEDRWLMPAPQEANATMGTQSVVHMATYTPYHLPIATVEAPGLQYYPATPVKWKKYKKKYYPKRKHQCETCPPGEQGIPGPPGPQGPSGDADFTKAPFAGMFCPQGFWVAGFNKAGNCVCSDGTECEVPSSPPPPPLVDPVILTVNGPSSDVGDILINQNYCDTLPAQLQQILGPICEDYIDDVAALLTGYEVVGTGEPDAPLTLYLDANCDPTQEWRQVLANDIQSQVATPFGLDAIFNLLAGLLIPSTDTNIGSDGNFTANIILASQSVLTVTVKAPEESVCSNAMNLPPL